MNILEFIKDNQLLTAALGLASAGIVSFWIKDFPKKIYELCLKHIVIELQVTNQHIIYYKIIKWIESNYKNKNFRNLKLNNGRWGEDTLIVSIGYGSHFIKYKKSYFLVILNKESANQTEKDKETIIFKKIGRSRKIFDEFINDVCASDENSLKIKLYKWNSGGYWEYVKNQFKRDISTIFIEKDKCNKLLNTLNTFFEKEKWYLKNSIPYQLGILLYGDPGTGKTSLIKVISSRYNLPIYYLPVGKIFYIEQAMSLLPDKCLLVIEDIDSNFIVQSRDEDKRLLETRNKNTIDLSFLGGETTLAEILNSLDGFFSSHGRILIATTNHVEKLDKALLRPGRFDLKIEIGYVNEETLKQFINYFFPDFDINKYMVGREVKDLITIATIQGLLLEEYDPIHILNTITNIKVVKNK